MRSYIDWRGLERACTSHIPTVKRIILFDLAHNALVKNSTEISRRAVFDRERVLHMSPKILDRHIERVSNLRWR